MNKIELLAPVGGIEHFFAAVENGADAVYLGGNKFNARIKADNFTSEQLSDVIRYAHLRNVKVYITVNTLLTDKEFPFATAYCTELYNLGADGIIVQDLGLAAWVKKNLPNFALHLSTQGTVYNLSGVRSAEALGFSRVVLARETSIDEIKKITNACDMEIEIFVHGALCMCYSGQCQLSRVIGGINGRSANKGLCAQPCRLPYGGEKEISAYPLSPKDLCCIDYLGEIIDAGVTSLKIEGRMKSPEYVAIVTGIYRKYLDQYLEKNEYQVSDEDRNSLRQIYSRGDFTSGYLFDNPRDEILSRDLPKHQGIYVGDIVNVLQGKKLIDVRMSKSLRETEHLSIGDGIEIRNEDLTGNLVTYLEKIDAQTLRIGDIKGYVEKGQSVYRTSQASLLKKARASYEGAAFIEGKSYKKVPIDIKLKVNIGLHPTIEICEIVNQDLIESGKFVFTDETIVVETAINKPLESSLAERQLRKTGSTCFEVKSVDIQIEAGSSLPLSALNKLRRDALLSYSNQKTATTSHIDNMRNTASCPVDKTELLKENMLAEEKSLAFYLYDNKQLEVTDFKSKMELLDVENAKVYIPLQVFMERLSDANSASSLPDYLTAIPYISNVSKGKLDEYIEKNFTAIVNAVKGAGIAIGNLGWSQEFIDEGIKVYADFGLNLSNEVAVTAARELGFSEIYFSLECQDEDAWPLLITEHPIKSSKLLDRKNQYYDVIQTIANDKWMLVKSSKTINDKSLLERWNNSTGEVRIFISPKS